MSDWYQALGILLWILIGAYMLYGFKLTKNDKAKSHAFTAWTSEKCKSSLWSGWDVANLPCEPEKEGDR